MESDYGAFVFNSDEDDDWEQNYNYNDYDMYDFEDEYQYQCAMKDSYSYDDCDYECDCDDCKNRVEGRSKRSRCYSPCGAPYEESDIFSGVNKSSDMSKESLEDLLKSDKILHPIGDANNVMNNKPTKKRKNKNRSKKSRKLRDRSDVSGVELFMLEILSWDILDLMKDRREALRLGPLVDPSLTYNHFSELRTVVHQVALLLCPIFTLICPLLTYRWHWKKVAWHYDRVVQNLKIFCILIF